MKKNVFLSLFFWFVTVSIANKCLSPEVGLNELPAKPPSIGASRGIRKGPLKAKVKERKKHTKQFVLQIYLVLKLKVITIKLDCMS